jgi:hypothetical protein
MKSTCYFKTRCFRFVKIGNLINKGDINVETSKLRNSSESENETNIHLLSTKLSPLQLPYILYQGFEPPRTCYSETDILWN